MRDRILSVLAILLLGAVSAASWWYARSLQQVAVEPAPRPGSVDFYADGLVLTVFDAQGRPLRRVHATRMSHVADTDDVSMRSPRLVTLRDDQPRVEARADHGRMEQTGEVVRLLGDVVVVRHAGTGQPPLVVRTDALTVWPDDDRYRSESPVEVTRGSSVITADGMEIDNIARTVDFRGEVRNRIESR